MSISTVVTRGYGDSIAAVVKRGFIASAMLPNAPSDLIATAISSSEINLVWTDNAEDEVEFQLERSDISDSSGFVNIDSPAANTESFSDSGLTPDTQYWYRIRATNEDGNSNWSNIATATTTKRIPPTGGRTLLGAGR